MLKTLWLVHPEEAMCAAFRDRFSDFSNIRVIRENFEGLKPHDCFVTAGNSSATSSWREFSTGSWTNTSASSRWEQHSS
jgi:kynureninase